MNSGIRVAALLALAAALCAVGAAHGPHLTASLDVVNPQNEVATGDGLTVVVNLVCQEYEEKFDVMLTYRILDAEGRVVSSESETVAVEVRNSHSKTLQIDEDAEEGLYTIEVVGEPLPSTGLKTVASREFRVMRMDRGDANILTIVLAAIAVVFAIALAYEHHRVDVLFKLSEDSLRRIKE